jgi:hypothetical protein
MGSKVTALKRLSSVALIPIRATLLSSWVLGASVFCSTVLADSAADAPNDARPSDRPPKETQPKESPPKESPPKKGPAVDPSKANKATRSGVIRAPVEKWRLIESESGPVNYYQLLRDAERPFIRGAYQPPHKKAVFGFELPEPSRRRVQRLDWNWRAIKMPVLGDECSPKKGDSPAVVYVTWRRTLRWYSLKYVWSTTRPTGTVCDRRRNPFVAQDTVVLESGGPLGVWKHESLDLAHEFRTHFEDGDPDADVPPLLGLGVMTDGDQTKTESTGDYADFVFSF